MISPPEGFTSNIIAYNNPIQSLPPIKSLQNKKDTTLMEMALKYLIKERLFSDVLSFNLNNNQNKNHRKNGRFSMDMNFQKIEGVSSSKQDSFKGLKKYKGYQTPKKRNSQLSQQKQRSKINKSYDQYLKNTNIKADQYFRKDKIIKDSSWIKKSAKTDFQKKYQHNQENCEQQKFGQKKHSPSFISAIEYNQHSNNPQHSIQSKNAKNIHKQSFTLPLLTKLPKSKNVEVKKTKNIQKVLFKKQLLKKAYVTDQFWLFLCQRQNKNSQNSNLETGTLQVKLSSIFELSMKKNFQKSKFLNKDLFQNFLKSKTLHISCLTNHIINFFQIGYKIGDRMKKQQFEDVFSNLANMNQRVWATCIFRFFDKDKNGQIDSSDLFSLFTQIDALKSEIQIALEKTVQIQQKQSKRLKTYRQNTQLSDISKKQSKSNKKSKINELSKLMINSSNEKVDLKLKMQENLQNIFELLGEINSLNKIIIKMPINNVKNLQQIVDKSVLIKSDKQNLLYLQQALLKKPELKANDLHLIIKQSDSALGNQKKKVIQIDPFKLNIKLSSAYIQTFVATDHNEQTRMNRQYIEGLKDVIKQSNGMNLIQQENPSNKRLKGISYKEFYEQNLYSTCMKIFFKAFKLTIIDPRK